MIKSNSLAASQMKKINININFINKPVVSPIYNSNFM